MPKITLLCPTLERHYYLERSIRFWGNRNVKVVYIDGSKVPFDRKNLGFSNILYIHNPSSIHQRLLGSLDLVSTPFVALIGDDEFYVPSALFSCVEFLELNPEYVSASGSAIAFMSFRNVVRLRPIYSSLAGRHLNQSNSLDRLFTHFSSYEQSHIYGVTRTEVFIKSIIAALNVRPDVFAIFELTHEFLVVASGKSIVLPNLYWLRSSEAAPIRNSGDRFLSPSKRLDDWWTKKDPATASERIEFCSMLAMKSGTTITTQDAVRVFDCYVNDKYFKNNPLPHGKRNLIKLVFKKLLPKSIVRGLYSVLSFLNCLPFWLGDPILQNKASLQGLRSQGVKVDEEGLAECFSSIENLWNA